MTTTEKPQEIQTTVLDITPPSQAKNFYILSVQPPAPLKYPIKYNVPKAIEGQLHDIKVGDAIKLLLQRGRPKVANPQSDKDWWLDLVGISRVLQETPLPPAGKAQGDSLSPREAPGGIPPLENGPKEAPKRSAGVPVLGDREVAIAQAHQENMAAHEEQMRAAAYLGAVIMGAIRAYLAKDPAPISTDAIKRAASDLWAEIKAR